MTTIVSTNLSRTPSISMASLKCLFSKKLRLSFVKPFAQETPHAQLSTMTKPKLEEKTIASYQQHKDTLVMALKTSFALLRKKKLIQKKFRFLSLVSSVMKTITSLETMTV